MEADRFKTHSLKDPRICRILQSALDAVEPGKLVSNYLGQHKLPAHEKIYLLGLGKAAEQMTLAAMAVLEEVQEALAITKKASGKTTDKLRIIQGGHPIPDERSLQAGGAALEFVSKVKADDLLIVLISGGGSALATQPIHGISLEEIRAFTSHMLAQGATIDEINTVRREIDLVKGGGLAEAARGRVLGLVLSDVIGDRLELIASGPTVPSVRSEAEITRVLKKYGFRGSLAEQITHRDHPTPRTDVKNIILGSNQTAIQAAESQAKRERISTSIMDQIITGEASLVGANLAARLKTEASRRPRPFCLIAGGETTVTLHGSGKGGRNQELALGAVEPLAGAKDAMLVAFATDGDDGPTDAAGAVTTGESRRRAAHMGMRTADFLSHNDAYSYFEALGDLLKPGYTGTNVNDLILSIGF